jgi:hypothetical protein
MKGFGRIFFWVGDCGVLLGFWETLAKERGVLVVNLWWMCGETW